MLKTKVKVGSVTNLSEARYCAGMGVDFLSFPIASVDPKTYQEITGWVAGPKFGIEVEKETLDAIVHYGADFIQVPSRDLNSTPPDEQFIVTVDLKNWQEEKLVLKSAKEKILLLELVLPAIDPNSEAIVREVCKEFEVLIKMNDIDDIDQVLQWPISGLSFEGSSEVRVGLKEYPLADVLEKLEID